MQSEYRGPSRQSCSTERKVGMDVRRFSNERLSGGCERLWRSLQREQCVGAQVANSRLSGVHGKQFLARCQRGLRLSERQQGADPSAAHAWQLRCVAKSEIECRYRIRGSRKDE
jgi:hypothetical protein